MSTATGSAPSGGHTASSNASVPTAPAASAPAACRTHVRAPSGREWTVSGRSSPSPPGATLTCTSTVPRSGMTSGASRVSSVSPAQPTCSPARSASSRNAVPGTTVRPCTLWSASQRCVPADSSPVSTTPSPSARDTALSSSGCPSPAPSPLPVRPELQ